MRQLLHLLCYMAAGCLPVIITPYQVNAQSWQWVESFGGPGSESAQVLASRPGNGTVFGGAYEAGFRLNGGLLPSFGQKDIFIAATDEAGRVVWRAAAGSTLEERLAGLAVDAAGDVIITGTYWQEAVFGDQSLSTKANLKGIFIAKYAGAGGGLKWVKGIDGTQLKEVTGLAVDTSGNIFISGYFQDSLFVENTTLSSSGASDLFLLKLNAEGDLQWAARDGLTGDTRAMRIALTPDEKIVIGGYFNDTTRIAGERLTANTFDRDVFLACYSPEGEALWARKAGGVHDDELTGLAVAPGGDIFVTGYLVGRMTLSETIVIESQTGQSDFYLLHYNAGGTPQAARAMGDRETVQQSTDLVLRGEEIIVSGFYSGLMTIDGQTIEAGAGFGSFLAAFDKGLSMEWIKNLPAQDGAFLNRLCVTTDGAITGSGEFRGSIDFDGNALQAGSFDIFLARLATTATSRNTPVSGASLLVYPIPASTTIFLDPPAAGHFEYRLFDAGGRQVRAAANRTTIDVRLLPAGLYILLYQDAERLIRRRVMVGGGDERE